MHCRNTLEDSRGKYHIIIITIVAVITVVVFAHGRWSLYGDVPAFTEYDLPRSSSIELVQYVAASQVGSGSGFNLPVEVSQFPETVPAKNGIAPAFSPVCISLLSIPAALASRLTPPPAAIEVSSDVGAAKAEWQRNYINFSRRCKLTTIFFQTPFLLVAAVPANGHDPIQLLSPTRNIITVS